MTHNSRVWNYAFSSVLSSFQVFWHVRRRINHLGSACCHCLAQVWQGTGQAGRQCTPHRWIPVCVGWPVLWELSLLLHTCRFLRRADEWVLKGISGYIYGLYLKKTFGVNEYRHWIKEVMEFVFICLVNAWLKIRFVCFQELDKIVDYELKMGGVLLHPTFSGGKEKDK